MLARRSFLGSIFAAGMAPAIVRSDSIMKIVTPKLWLPRSALLVDPHGQFGCVSYQGWVTAAKMNADWMERAIWPE
jgi:hypothetical protein